VKNLPLTCLTKKYYPDYWSIDLSGKKSIFFVQKNKPLLTAVYLIFIVKKTFN